MADKNDKFDFSENPFVGPHPIETGRNIFGRNREIDDLYYLLSAERIVMLHSPSGAGKTSLIQAGLIPRLNERFDVWGPTRVNQLPSATSSATVNRYIRSAVLGFEQQIPAERHRTEEQLGEMTLAEYVASRREESKNIVLIFDQFEEILTADPLAIDAKHEFFKQLGELLLDPRIWALFAMREDYLPALDPYAEQVPTHLKNWFRLDLLRRDKATEAITETTKEGGRQVDQEAVTELVTDLATMKVQQPDGTFAPQKGLYVEPLQLQVVCRRLWERMPTDKQTIDRAEIEQSGDVTTALADYYAAEVARLANGDVRIERKLREWVGERLITPDGIRSQVLRGAGNSEGLDNELIASLVNTYLVRGEQREGATWYELAHDRLIEPIRNNNRDWFDTHLHKVQKLVSLWEKDGRPDRFLLIGADLVEANQWAEQNEASQTAIERKFLDASAARQEAIEREERHAKRLRKLLVALAAVALLALGAAGYALISYLEANYQQSFAKYQEQNAYDKESEAQKFAREASLQKTLSNVKRDEAEAAKLAEEFQRKLAEQTGNKLVASYEQSNGLLVIARNFLAQEAIDKKDYTRAEDVLLASYKPPGTPKDEDLRSFDWFYLWRQLHDEKATLKGHTTSVRSVAFTLDGRTLASGASDNTIKLWDVASGKEKATLRGHAYEVQAVAFTNDGRMLASGSSSNTIKLWDVASGKEIATLLGHADNVWSVAFTSDGRTLASGSWDKTIKLWDVASRQEKATLKGHTNQVGAVAFTRDDRTLASGGWDNTIKLWDVASRQEKATLRGHSGRILSVAFTNNGGTLASGSDDKTIKLWDVASELEEATLRGHVDEVNAVTFTSDGRTLASGSDDKTIKLWDVASKQEKVTLRGHADEVNAVTFTNDGRTLASGSSDRTIKMWSGTKGQEKVMLKGLTKQVRSVAFTSDGRTLATAGADDTVKLWDVASGQEKATLIGPLIGHTASVGAVAFTSDGRTLASGSWDGTIKLWDVTSGQKKAILTGHSGSVWSLAFTSDDRTLASGSDDNTIRLWDVTKRREKLTLRGHTSSVRSLALTSDGRTLASGSDDNTIRLWDLASGREKATLRGHTNLISSVAFTIDGRMLASGSADETIKLWDVTSSQEKATLKGLDRIRSVAFTSDSRTLVSGLDDKTIKLWDIASRQEKATLRGHTDNILFVAFTSDGRTLVSAGYEENSLDSKWEGTIRLWHGATNAEVARDCFRCKQKD